jgi:tetratricopeptide (TPR) repeat protein
MAQVPAEPSAEVRAVDLNRRSAELFRQGRYSEAAALLREAYRLKPDPVLQYNLARACDLMADYACAVAAYESYLTKAQPTDRPAVEARLASSRARLAEAPADAATPDSRGRSHSVLPPIVTAIGVVGLGVGVGLVQVARARHDDAVTDPSQRGAAETQASAESLMRTANVTLVAGGVVAAAGLVWWIIDATSGRPASQRPGAELHIGAGAVAVSVRF